MIIVTGGAGFIGSNLARFLVMSGREVVICETFESRDSWKNIADLDVSVISDHFVLDLIADEERRCRAVIHLGALTSTMESDLNKLLRTNVALSQELFLACKKRHIPFIYASSAAVYGNGERGFREDAPHPIPLNPYAFSKLLFDRWVLRSTRAEVGRRFDWCWRGLRFFNVYGPHELHKGDQASVVSRWTQNLDKNIPTKMFLDPLRNEEGSSGLTRDFVYVGDCIAVIEWCLRTMDGSPELNGIYNVGTGEAKTFDQVRDAVVAAFSSLTKRDPDLLRGGFFYGPMPRELVPQYQRFTKADISKLRDAGYIDRFQTLDEAVKETVDFYVA